MNAFLRSYKKAIRNFMRAHYSDERLAMLLAHAQSGRLAYSSCCCFIGVATADHALQGAYSGPTTYDPSSHCATARQFAGAMDAELAYYKLWRGPWGFADADEVRRRRLIPMIRAEMRRRERVRAEQYSAAEAVLLA